MRFCSSNFATLVLSRAPLSHPSKGTTRTPLLQAFFCVKNQVVARRFGVDTRIQSLGRIQLHGVQTHCSSRHSRCPKTRGFHAASHPSHVWSIPSVCARRHVGCSSCNLGMHRVCTQSGVHMQISLSYRLPTVFKNLYRPATSRDGKRIAIISFPRSYPWPRLSRGF